MRQKLAPANKGISAIASLAKPSPSDDRILGQITADAFRNRFGGVRMTYAPEPRRRISALTATEAEEDWGK
jgi:hypothetical protein